MVVQKVSLPLSVLLCFLRSRSRNILCLNKEKRKRSILIVHCVDSKIYTKCTKLNGEDRPTMREVEMTLENLRGTKKQVHNTTSRRKYEKDHYMSSGELTLDTSRQYTMEEEILLSARYPR